MDFSANVSPCGEVFLRSRDQQSDFLDSQGVTPRYTTLHGPRI